MLLKLHLLRETRKKSELQMGFEHTNLRDIAGSSLDLVRLINN